MSNQSNSFSNPLNKKIIQSIDQLNLSIIQKHHVRLLAHCLEIFKELAKDDMSSCNEDVVLREWCQKQSQEFNDKNFNELFYEQMSSAATKLKNFSATIGKNLKELDIDDLILLVKQNSDN